MSNAHKTHSTEQHAETKDSVVPAVIPFPATAYVYNGMHYTPISAFAGIGTTPKVTFFDQVSQKEMAAAITTNDGTTLTVTTTTGSTAYSFPMKGEGSAMVPVALLG